MAARIHPFKTKTLKLFPTRHFLEIASTRSVLVAGARPDSTHTHVWCLQGYYECPVALASLWRRNHGCTPKSVRLRERCVASDPSLEAMEHNATPPPLRHNAVYSLPMRTSPGAHSKQGVAHAFGKICRLQGACKRTALRGCWVQIQPSRALNCPGWSGSRTHCSPLLRASVPIPCSPVESPCVPMGTHFLAWFWREN